MSRLSLAVIALAALAAPALAGPATDDVAARHAALRAELAARRTHNLDAFHAYRKRGVYPHNTYEPGMLNVWSDADDHLCAVATLMKQSGLDDLVAAIALEHNFVRTADLVDGPVVDWILTSGFTQEEIVMIQQPTAADEAEMEREMRREKRARERARAREDRRLAHNYAATERALRQPLMTDAALDLATARLEQHPALATALLGREH